MRRRIVAGFLFVTLLTLSGYDSSAKEFDKRGRITVDGTGVAWCYHEPKPCPLLKPIVSPPDPQKGIDIHIWED